MKFFLGIIFAALVGSVVSIGIKSVLQSTPEAAPVVTAPALSDVLPMAAKSNAPEVPPPAYVGPNFVASSQPERVVWVTGTMIHGQKVWAYLSDGRVFRESTKGLTRVDGEGLVIDGERIWMRPFARPAVVAGAFSTGPTGAPSGLPEMPLNQPEKAKLPPPPSSAPSSWIMHSDGVQRVVGQSRIGG